MRPGYQIVTGPLDDALNAVVDATTAALRDARPLIACKHVISGERVLFVCNEHPAAGVLCHRCSLRHVGRHSDDLEHTCDRCRNVVPSIHAAAGLAVAAGIRARDTSGRSRELVGEVVIGCIGFCAECTDNIERQVA